MFKQGRKKKLQNVNDGELGQDFVLCVPLGACSPHLRVPVESLS